MAYGTVNADVIGTSVAGSNLGAGNASIMKNRIINGAMVINQRGGTVTATSAGPYTLDRFYALTTTGAYTVQQSSVAPAGFNNSLLCTVTSAATPAAGDVVFFNQTIEGYNFADLNFGTANAKTFTISFWAQSSLAGVYCVGFRNNSGSLGYAANYTITTANTWQFITVTVPGCTTGTWETTNAGGVSIYFDLGSGSNRNITPNTWVAGIGYKTSSQTNWISTSGATFYITGVQLEVGSSATGYEYRQYGQELALCQRYYETGTLYATGYGNGTNGVSFSYPMKVTKRASPTGALGTSGYVNYPSPIFATDDVNTVYLTQSSASASGYVRAIVTFNITAEL